MVEKAATAIKVDQELPEEKKEKQYKGTLTTVADLLKLKAVGHCVQRMIPANQRPKEGVTRCTLPKFFIVEKIEQSTKGLKYIHYVDTRASKSYNRSASYAPDDMPVKILTGTLAKARIDSFEAFKKVNFDRYINSYGMQISASPEVFLETKNESIVPGFEVNTPGSFYGNGAAPVNKTTFHKTFNTTVGGCLAYGCDYVHNGLVGIHSQLKKEKDTRDIRISNTSVIELPTSLIKEVSKKETPESRKNIRNVYGLSPKGNPKYRVANGVMNFSLQLTEDEVVEAVKSLDCVIGIACVSLFADYDLPVRREISGLAGEYELLPKVGYGANAAKYSGFKYRTLSNAWLIHPVIMHLVFDLSRKAIALGLSKLRHRWKGSEQEVIRIIQECDVKAARKMMEDNKHVYFALLRKSYPGQGEDRTKLAYNVFLNGINKVIASPNDLTKNWSLNGGWVNHSGGESRCWSTASTKIAAGKKL